MKFKQEAMKECNTEQLLNTEQQITVLKYAITFLKNEIYHLEESIKNCQHKESKKLLIQRKKDLEFDLEELEPIGDRV